MQTTTNETPEIIFSDKEQGPFFNGNTLHEVYSKASDTGDIAKNYADMLADWENLQAEDKAALGLHHMLELNKKFIETFQNAHYSLIEQTEKYIEKLHVELEQKAN